MIYDVFCYNGEEDILEIRLNILGEVVDQFIIVECPSTFGGTPKPIYYELQKERFKKWEHKIRHVINPETYTPEQVQYAANSPATNGYARWMNEFLQKEYPKEALRDLNDDDMVFYGDVDEIWNPELAVQSDDLFYVRLRVYAYYLNMCSSEKFWGTLRAPWKYLKDKYLNNLRKNMFDIDEPYQGWHFTNQGGIDSIRKKIFDQYNPEVFGDETYYNLEKRFGVVDYVGRDFQFWVDESEWPEYLKEHRQDYYKLLK